MTDQTGGERPVTWPTCGEVSCIGVQLPQGGKCLAHATTRRRNAALKQCGETGEIDARGVPITAVLLHQILAKAPRNAEDDPTFREARFDRATFQEGAGFRGATFQGDAWFTGATIHGDAWFTGAAFHGDAWFHKAIFHGDAVFSGATFRDDAGFIGATFHDDAVFSGATFRDDAWFIGAVFRGGAGFIGTTFRGDARFAGATFHGGARFRGATFHGDAGFIGATFQGYAGLAGATFRRIADFGDARFEQARQLGPLLVYGLLRLDATHFAQLIQIEASARGLSCQRTRFPAGVQFQLRGAQIVMDDADLPSPSLLVGITALSDPRLARHEQRLAQAVRRLAPPAAVELWARPRLLSVQGANVAGLGLANVDLAQCRFAGAHNLDRLRLETEVSFSAAPVRLPWDRRQVIAEERTWRAAHSKRWATPQCWPAWLHRPFNKEWPGALPTGQIAGVYRALRKGREDAKDEPGAADFYYGEMEMRRHADHPHDSGTDHPTGEASRGQIEHSVLTVYWLISGYGLRAWRALVALTVVLIAFAGLQVWVGGYQPASSSPVTRPASTATGVATTQTVPVTTVPTSTAGSTTAPVANRLTGALLYGARTIVGLNPIPLPQLNRVGEVLLIGVRILGPLLLGLALLAVRGRVKR
jgi:uncharacterized protein YjbI with pentapeptide repeats